MTTTAHSPGENASGATDPQASKYLTFRLANEAYAVEILRVQEIIGMMEVTCVPKTPDFVRGVINLRGKIIPVVDLRVRFGMGATEPTDRTCIVVVQVVRGDRMVTMGTMVDEVSEVLSIPPSLVEPPPELGSAVHTEFLQGLGKMGQKVVMLLDVDRILSLEEVAAIEPIQHPPS